MTPIIKYRLSNPIFPDEAKKFTQHTIMTAIKHMDIARPLIKSITIADDKTNYDKAIKELSPTEGFTDDAVLLGIGKCIPAVTDSMCTHCDIVLNICVIACFSAKPPESIPVSDAHAIRYSLYHELGHCIDYTKRQSQHMPTTFQMGNSQVQNLMHGNPPILLSEYAACYLSAPFISIDGITAFVNKTHQNITAYVNDLTNTREQHNSLFSSIEVLNKKVLDVFWRGLLEITKISALLHGNPKLNQALLNTAWPVQSQEIENIFNSYSAELRNAWTNYPNCEQEFAKVISFAWHALIQASGYRYEIRDDGDYLYLN